MFAQSLRTQKDLSISWKKVLSVSSMQFHVSGAQDSLWTTNNFFFIQVWPRFLYFEATQKWIHDVIGDVFRPTCPNKKCLYLSNNKNYSFHDCKNCNAQSHEFNNPSTEQKWTKILFGGDGTHCFARKSSRVSDSKEKPSPFLNKLIHNHNQKQSNLCQKIKYHSIFGINLSTPHPHWLIHTANQKLIPILAFFTSSLQ